MNRMVQPLNPPLAPMLLLCLATGCSSHLSPMDRLAWDVHPGMVEGEILVAPVLVVAEAPTPDLTGIVGEKLDGWQARGRMERTADLAELPYAFHAAVPGALYRNLPPQWEGHFRDTRLSLPQQIALTSALNDPERSPTPIMAEIAIASGADAVLFTWVVEADGRPLTDEHLVGELVVHEGVPVVVDHDIEPYAVDALIGVALVAADGDVLFRYEDRYSGLLVGDGPEDLGRTMARSLVDDITPYWLDPTLETAPALAEK
jgi:hypothetical protein